MQVMRLKIVDDVRDRYEFCHLRSEFLFVTV
jgi:hypothetical protein